MRRGGKKKQRGQQVSTVRQARPWRHVMRLCAGVAAGCRLVRCSGMGGDGANAAVGAALRALAGWGGCEWDRLGVAAAPVSAPQLCQRAHGCHTSCSAWSSFSTGMLVQVRCIMVFTHICRRAQAHAAASQASTRCSDACVPQKQWGVAALLTPQAAGAPGSASSRRCPASALPWSRPRPR